MARTKHAQKTPMRIGQRIWSLLPILLFLAGTARADIVYFRDGTSSTSYWVSSFSRVNDQQDYLWVIPVAQGGGVGKPENLDIAKVAGFDLRGAGDTGETPQGRYAHLDTDRARVYHVVIEAGQNTDRGWVFRIRKAGVPPGGKTFTFGTDFIKSFTTAPVHGSVFSREEPITEGVITGKRLGRLKLLPEDPSADKPPSYLDDPTTSQPPGVRPPIDNGPPPIADEDATRSRPAPRPPAIDGEEERPVSGDEAFGEWTGINAVYGDKSPFKKEEKEEKKGFFDIGSTTSGAQIMAMGFLATTILVGIIMAITFLVGTFVLLFSAKNEGINDLTVPRAMATAALLAVVPPGLFFGSLFIPIPLCSVKLILGLFLWWFSARMIVAGMLEVMEGKATDVLVSFYAILVLILMGFWIYNIYA